MSAVPTSSVLRTSPPNSESANLGERERILGWCVYAGPHLQEEGWLMLFRFPNGLQASVAFTPWTRGIEVGVVNGEWLVDVIEDLSGEDVLKALRSVMLRSLA